MPVAGEIMTAASIASGRRMLASAGRQFERAGRAAGDAAAALHAAEDLTTKVPLRALEAAALERAIGRMSGSMVWADDMLCRQRAMLGAAMIQQEATGSMLAPAQDALVAAVVSARSRMVGMRWGSFHEAILFRPAEGRGLQVLDLVLFDRPVSLTRWARAVGARPAELVVHSPFLHARGAAATNPARLLDERWEYLSPGVQLSRRDLLDPAGTDTILTRLRAEAA